MIYLDACLVIYLIEQHARWSEPVAGAIAQAEGARFGISPLVKCECLIGPIKRGDPVLQRAYMDLFDQFASLDMPEPVYLQAALLRGLIQKASLLIGKRAARGGSFSVDETFPKTKSGGSAGG